MKREDIKLIITVLTLIGSGIFWLFTINGLPSRVKSLEETVRLLEQKMDKNDVKTDMILDTVKLIQAHLLQLERGKGTK